MNKQWEIEFAEKFKCIQSDCDGAGNIPHQVAEGEWEAQQCQFHAEYLFPIKDFIREALASQRETLAMEIEGMKKDEEKARKFKGEDTSGWLLGTLNRNQALTDAAAHIRKQ